MNIKTVLAAAAATLALTALPAAAEHNDRGGRSWDRGGAIIVRHDAGVFRFERGDREYRRLVRYFGFEPGYRYGYTHDCNAYGCDVIVYGRGGRPIDRFHAPYFRHAFDNHRVPGNRDGSRRWR